MAKVYCLITEGYFENGGVVMIAVPGREPVLAFVKEERVTRVNGENSRFGEVEVEVVEKKSGRALVKFFPPDESPIDGDSFYIPIDDVIW